MNGEAFYDKINNVRKLFQEISMEKIISLDLPYPGGFYLLYFSL
jgi:hypothetical protein